MPWASLRASPGRLAAVGAVFQVWHGRLGHSVPLAGENDSETSPFALISAFDPLRTFSGPLPPTAVTSPTPSGRDRLLFIG